MQIDYTLLPTHGVNEVSKIFTEKLKEHSKNEWKYGISWTEVLSNLKKHLNEFESGSDFDENGLLHIASVASQALILCEYYKIYPQGDDRQCNMISKPIIALDIDDVCLDFISAIESKYGIKLNPYWNGTYNMKKYLDELSTDKEFWTNLPALHIPTFEPDMYITSRSIPVEWTMENLEKMGFPCAPVYSCPWNTSKVDLLKTHKVDILIDDKPANYKEATEAGVFCYLMDAAHNRWFKVPEHRRIKDLNLDF